MPRPCLFAPRQARSSNRNVGTTLALCRDADVLSAFSFIAASLGHAHLLLGHPDQAWPILEEAVSSQKMNFSVTPSTYPLTALAESYRLNGQIERAIQNTEEALSIFRRNGERGFGVWALYYMAKIQSEYGSEQLPQAESALAEIK